MVLFYMIWPLFITHQIGLYRGGAAVPARKE